MQVMTETYEIAWSHPKVDSWGVEPQLKVVGYASAKTVARKDCDIWIIEAMPVARQYEYMSNERIQQTP